MSDDIVMVVEVGPAWPTTAEGWCERFTTLDRIFGTSLLSPLHHDNRCPVSHWT